MEILSFQRFLVPFFRADGGDKRDRTADLLNAIQALSQLSYTPKLQRRTVFLFGASSILTENQPFVNNNLKVFPSTFFNETLPAQSAEIAQKSSASIALSILSPASKTKPNSCIYKQKTASRGILGVNIYFLTFKNEPPYGGTLLTVQV